jgi:cation transport ATPase
LKTNVIIGLGWTIAIIGLASLGFLGVAGAVIAAILHNVSTLLVLANAGRILRYEEPFAI